MALDWIVHCYASKYAFENKMVLLEGNIFDDEFNISVSFFFFYVLRRQLLVHVLCVYRASSCCILVVILASEHYPS